MISPSVVGLPSLPAVERSTTGVVNVSVRSVCFGATAALMRGPAPQAALGAAVVGADAAGASDGKASTEPVSGVPPFAVATAAAVTAGDGCV